MSPRAAWRLETLGFTAVHDYTAGEADWAAYGLPLEGAMAGGPHVGELTRRDIPRCGLRETVGEVRERVLAAGWDVCVVVSDEGIVLGLLRRRELDATPESRAEEVMRSGPATYRPDAIAQDATARLKERGASGVLVTRLDGTLIGWFRPQGEPQAQDAPSRA